MAWTGFEIHCYLSCGKIFHAFSKAFKNCVRCGSPSLSANEVTLEDVPDKVYQPVAREVAAEN